MCIIKILKKISDSLEERVLKTDEWLTYVLEAIKSSQAYQELPKEQQLQLNQVLNKDYLTSAISEKTKAKKAARAQKSITLYQLKIALKGIRPPIWRRVVVPSHITFAQLHDVIQTVMGWEDYHLYEFEIDDILIDIPDEEYGFSFVGRREKHDARKEKLEKFVTEEGEKFTYTYDFGDHWVHTITLEKIETTHDPLPHPICLKGKRACPPEDIGGIYGYMEVMDMLNGHGTKEEIEEFVEWYGGDYDPEYFDIDETNERLRSITFL
jgi:hypothetical protein